MSWPPDKVWTARELRKLPQEERDKILSAAALLEEQDYCDYSELTLGGTDSDGENGTQNHSAHILMSACAWAAIWGVGGWLFSTFETDRHSWLIDMPLYMLAALIVSGVIRGGVFGAFLGGLAGIVGLLVFMRIGYETKGWAFNAVPPWVKAVPPWATVELVWTAGGIVAGGLAGALDGGFRVFLTARFSKAVASATGDPKTVKR